MPSNSMIVDWFVNLAISDMLTTDDILSGNTVNTILKKTIPGFKSDFATPATALNKITNWNSLIKSLQKINIKVSADEKNSIFHGNQTVVYNILSQIKDYVDQNNKQPEVDLNKIDYRSDPKQSKSLLELFILVIIKNLGLNAKQSVALLSNDSKYLAHILAKGFKDQPGPVINLLRDFQSLLPKIHQFCANKQNQIFFLKSFKPGLISKFKEISELALQILQQFSLQTSSPFEILKVQLIPTLILQYRRHPIFLNPIAQTIIKLSKYTKPLLTVLTNNMNQKELLTFCYEILTIAEESNQIKNFFNLSKVEQMVTISIDCLNDSNTFSIALLFLVKMIQTNPDIVTNDPQNLKNTLKNLQHLAINKMEHFAAYVNGLFTLLVIFGTKKHPIAPQFFKLCIEKYKLAINYDESISYGYNLLHLIEDFPSIPTSAIVDAVVERYENYKEVITDLDIQLLTRVAFGFNRNSQDQQHNEENFKIPDEKTSLKIYNILSKIFFEDISNAVGIADAIVFLVLSHPNSDLLKDLNLKMVKVGLAVHFGNIRKLNMSKSIVQGTIKLDYSNAFAKRKNMDIEYLLKQLLNLKNEEFNNTVEPLICYSYIQSESKNRNEAQELGKVLSVLGNVNTLVKKYEQEVRILHEEKRAKKKAYPIVDQEEQSKLNSASSDLIKKKKIPSGQNYSMYLSRIQKITPDAKLGLLKAQKGFDDKKKKAELEQIKRLEEQQKKEELQKKHTTKVLEKGIRVDTKAEFLNQYIYDFNTKQNQLKKDQCYDLTSLQIFNPNEEQQNDLQALKYLMKKYNKVLKILYSNYSGRLKPNSISCFDEMGEKLGLMQTASFWKIFKDFELDEFMTIREAQYLVQKINTIKKKSYHDTSLLDFEAFEDLIIQASLTMFTRPPKNLTGHTISQMVEETFYQFKMLAGQNRIDIRLFDDQSTTFEQDDQSANLTNQLRKNPDYILPEGYKKVVQKKVDYFHTVALDAFDSSYTDVLNVLNDILFQKMGLHILEPFSQITTNIYAKSVMSKKKEENTDDFKEKYFSLSVKKQLFKFSSEDRTIAREVAFCLSQITDAVYLGRTSITKNKYSTKQLEEQRRKADEEMNKRRQKRDEELKRALEKQKTQKEQLQQNSAEQKAKEQKKAEQERKKREKYEQELKKKVQEFQQKRRDQFRKEEQQRMAEKKKQQQVFEKKRLELSKAAKQIQEKKEKEKKEAQQKEKLLKQKSKKNLKIRSSPKPLKKLIEESKSQVKNLVNQKLNEKENKNLAPVASKSQPQPKT